MHAPDKHGWHDRSADAYTEEFLYDLYADPYELHNLVGLESHQEVAEVMKARLLRRMVAAGEARATITPAPPSKAGQRKVTRAEALS